MDKQDLTDNIRSVLKKFQEGYSKRSLTEIDEYMDHMFIKSDDTFAIGTGTGELCLGFDEVKDMIKSDWEYWGDVLIDYNNAIIDGNDNVAWFTVLGNVKYSFEHSENRSNSYVNFTKNILNKNNLTVRQKLTFINYAYALTYHHRSDGIRDYYWKLGLSGFLVKEEGKWKILKLHFSIEKPDFPDERFESSDEFIKDYLSQNEKIEKLPKVNMDVQIKALLVNFEKLLFSKNEIYEEDILNIFVSGDPLVLDSDNKLHEGTDSILSLLSFFDGRLSLDYEHVLLSKHDDITWIGIPGLLKTNIKENELYNKVAVHVENIIGSNLKSEEKNFRIHRIISHALYQTSSGSSYTWPLRLTGVIVKKDGRALFSHLHISNPSYWIFEGKLNSIK